MPAARPRLSPPTAVPGLWPGVVHRKILPDLVYAVHLKISRQFEASVFGIPLVVRIHNDL